MKRNNHGTTETRNDTGNHRSGITLIELLVAFIIFVLLIFTLVMLTNITLDAWNYGEERKDGFDRSTALLSILEEDLRNVFTERQLPWIGKEDQKVFLPAAQFVCELDAQGRSVLKFVRVSDRDEMEVKPDPIARRKYPPDMFANLYEIVYAMDDDPKKTILYRGIRFFDRDDRKTIFGNKLDKTILKPIESGLLHIEYKFWAQDTPSWDKSTTIWDSSRATNPKFRFYQRKRDSEYPDFVYPEMVQLTIVLKSQAFTEQKMMLTEDLSDSATVARVNTTRDLPEPPGLIRINGEWVEYRAKDFSAILLSKRGQRGTQKSTHSVGSEIMFGELFTRTIYLPIRQEAIVKR
jgi:hypothetical protein